MELQLNLTSNAKKNKGKKNDNKAKPKSSGSTTINFVKNTTFEGKTIARRRKPPPIKTKSTTFSFLNNKPDKDVLDESPNSFKNKQHTLDGTETKSPEEYKEPIQNNEFSLNITQGKSKNSPRKNDTRNKSKSYGNESFNQSNKNDNFRPKPIKEHDSNALPTFRQISALFKNNPEIPKIGQRHVKPVTEKLFSGKNFSDLNIHSFNVANLEKNMGLKELTVVQQKAIPVILNGRDVLVRSQTGSGKTLAYALPIVEGLQALRPKLKRQDGIKALVIVPTRELALQTYELFIKLVRSFTWIVPGYLIGGEKRKAEKARIRKGFNILIGTPGRICDHLKHTVSLKLGGTRCLVLDEADRLLDMGYEKDVASIVQSLESHKASDGYDPLNIVRQSIKQSHIHFDEDKKIQANDELNETKEEGMVKYEHELSKVFLSEKRQTILLSATLTKAVETLAGLTMQDPVFIDSSEDRGTVIADSIVQPKKSEIKEEDDETQGASDDDLEIVPQEKDDSSNEESDESSDEDEEDDDEEVEEGDNENDDIKEEDSDDEESDSDDSDQNSDEEEKKKNAVVYKGLKMFGGIKTEKLKQEIKTEKKKKIKKGKKKPENESKAEIKEESDSDSDYDFFSAVKTVSIPADPDTKIVTDSGDHSNPFQNAIKTALAQDEMVIPSSVDQIYIVIPMKLRLVTLSALIVEKCVTPGHGKMLVFMATQDMIDYHCELLSRVLTGKNPKNDEQPKDQPEKEDSDEEDTDVKDKMDDSEGDDYNFDAIPLEAYEAKMRADKAFVNVEFFQLHGSMDQKTRTEVFKTFRKANSGVLLCTDVAARGLDLPRVDCIVQFTGPISATDYVHRVGRTARAGNVGTAIMFLLPSEVLFVRQLEERRIRLRQEDMDKVLNSLNRKGEIRNRHNAEQIAATKLQQTYEELVEADKELFTKACKAFTSWMRFYSTYPREARAAFDRKALHAGHAARALALRSAPKEIARSAPKDKQERPNNRLTNQTPEERKERIQKKKKESVPVGFDSRPQSAKAAKRDRLMMISEFDSGLEPLKKKKK